jgi:hypothetical protein
LRFFWVLSEGIKMVPNFSRVHIVARMIGIPVWERKRPDLALEVEEKREGVATAPYAEHFDFLLCLQGRR